ncbi:MAG TPA: SDR family oxidoreductase [Aggregatilineales bacterium]|nr:SDR family oxidoreductase [Chloroflexota bacterium]HOA23013.1 SDR family oxidoreductase [Aggregatilineales bacterium]HPV08317.1 SDR family oxidoreductase [Aggregatilineales bacterium]HQA67610.1 SDR family oxidoreductase [Aggregatilineales bacterium]HQE16904.1 SDR family oxidoreductase [Aggregatilineales bacterium]
MDLNGKVALVTGGARRVGKAIALGLAARGMNVLIHYNRSEAEARQTLDEIRAMGVQAEAVQGNLGNPLDIEHIFVTLESTFRQLDLLVNSASTFLAGHILEATVSDWNYVMAVNLRAPFLCSQRAAHLMLARQSPGVIINIADVAGQVPWTRFPIHSVSKAGLIMLTQVLAKSLGPDIRVNAVVPGPVLKPDAMPDARWEALSAALPLERAGTPENVVQAVLALAENDFITGAVLNVDGGDSLLGSIDLAGLP